MLSIDIFNSINHKPTYAAQKVLSKVSGINIDGYKDYRGVLVYGAWLWDDTLHTAFVTEIDKSEAMGVFNETKNTIFIIVFSIILFSIFLTLLVAWISTKSKSSLQKANEELNNLLESFDKNVIAAKIDIKGAFTYVSHAKCDISGYAKDELLGKNYTNFLHSDMHEKYLSSIQNTLKDKHTWRGELKYINKNGGIYWVNASIEADYDSKNNIMGYSIIKHDITAQKEVEDLTVNLELKVTERTNEIQKEKEFNKILLDSQEQLIITTDGSTLITANKTFFNFYLQIQMDEDTWIDYVISRSFSETNKVMITKDSTNFIFSVTATNLPGEEELKSAVFTDITEMENAKIQIEDINKHTRESIEYASLIQGALIPDSKIFKNHFQDHFTIWHPKDTVGGDIYLLEELREKDECLLLVIDCTGHGVPGAFVTMLVKAIERQITAKINNSDELVSPAKILSIFNKNMKQLLKQESADSVSNAGFDGGVIYYNKKEKMIKFAGAETHLFYIEEDKLQMIKGSRYSAGYKKCDINYRYEEHTLEVKEGMKFYLTTDGYLDQNGGEKSFPFGKRKFSKLIEKNYHKPMNEQEKDFLNTLDEYQGNEERNDDVTVVGFQI